MGRMQKGWSTLLAILFAIASFCLQVLQAAPVGQVVRGCVCGGACLQELEGDWKSFVKKKDFNIYREISMSMTDLVSNVWHWGCSCIVLGQAAGVTQKSARIPGKASGYSCGCVTLLVRVRRLHWEFYFIFKPRRDLVSLMFVLDYLVFVGFVGLFFSWENNNIWWNSLLPWTQSRRWESFVTRGFHVFETNPNLCHAVGDLKLPSCFSVAHEKGDEGFRGCCHWISWQPLSVQSVGACAPCPLCCLRDDASPVLYCETSGRKWVPRTNGATLQRVLSPLVSFDI